LARIYHFLRAPGACIPQDWLAGQIERLDRMDGDIDALSKRLAFIRTWTYVANRPSWINDAEHWRDTTRAVEDRLSDALHERLKQRFVDRRTSHLMRRLKQKERLVAEIDDKGKVSAEGHYLGRLDGFRFTIDESASGDELKMLRSASTEALQAEFARRADKLYLSPDGEIDVTDQGGLMWGTDAIGRVISGDDPLSPKITVFVDEIAEPAVAEKVERRLSHWLARRINTLFEPMLAMRDDEAITGLAKGVAFRLAETFGIIRRPTIATDIKSLAQEERALLRKHGVRFGQHFIFMPAMLKPAATRLRLLLWNLANGHEDFAGPPPPGHVTLPADDASPEGYYEMAGYSRLGVRALRIDMLERLADLLRPMDVRGGFEATQDMLSITGCTLEQFADLMGGLGFANEHGERPKTVRTPAEAAPKSDQPEAPAEESAGVAGSADVETTSEVAEVVAEAVAQEATPEVVVEEAAAGKAAPEATEMEAATEEAVAEATEPDSTTGQAAPEAAEPKTATDEAAPETAEPAPVDATIDAAAETPAEPATNETATDETEIFYTFRLTPRGRPNRDGRRRPQGERPQGERPQGEGPQREGQEDRDQSGKRDERKPRGRRRSEDGKGQSRHGAGKDFGGAKGRNAKGGKPRHKDQGAARQMQASPPKKDRPIDPDNPFAVLQQLKND